MAYNLRNSNKRRQLEANQERETKHRKQTEVEVNATDAGTITNICNELIARIFDFLDPESLLNVAGTCKRLQIAAAAKYGQKYGKYTIILCPRVNVYGELLPQYGSRFEQNMVQVFRLTALPFFRCFGAQISHLHVDTLNNNHVARYINRYCADTLTTLKVNYLDQAAFTIENCPKSFKMVEEIHFYPLSKQFLNFPYLFPSLRKLLFWTRRFDLDISSVVFPHLEELAWFSNRNSYSEKRRMEKFVRTNQQVRYLRLKMYQPQFSNLLKMISGHTMISKLEVGFPNVNSKHVKRNLLLRFARKHHAVAELDFIPFLLRANDAIASIRRLGSLKYFRFRLKDHAEYNYFVNQLQQEIGFMFEVKLNGTYTTFTVVELKLNR